MRAEFEKWTMKARPRWRLLVSGGALLLSVARVPELPAQRVLEPGTRVRVAVGGGVPGAGLLIGTVTTMDATAIGVQMDLGPARSLPLASVLRIDVSRGRGTHRGVGAALGGVLSGAAFVVLACKFSDGSCDVGGSNVGGFMAYYAIGAIPGVFAGASIGGRYPGNERWREHWRR